MEKETMGTVISVTKQWWLKVNRKPVRAHAMDGAAFPHTIKVKCGTLLRRWPPTVPESAPRTGRSSHSRTVHPKTGEHHRE
jgi:hypothetical protein